MLAIEFGRKYGACEEAMEWYESLGPDATQADAYLACDRGGWLIWQLTQDPAIAKRIREPLNRMMERMVARAIRRARKALVGVRAEWATEWRRWARRWLSGEDRSEREAQRLTGLWASETMMEKEIATRMVGLAMDAALWMRLGYVRGAADMAVLVAGARAIVACTAERKRQALDIRKEIPVWPGA